MKKIKNHVPGKKCNKIVQKLLSLGVSASLMFAVVPLNFKNFVAKAVGSQAIPDDLFITKQRLLYLCRSVNNGDGLLAFGPDENGDTTDKLLRLNFGNRKDKVTYKSYDDVEKTIGSGPMTWLIAGYDAADNSENAGLILYMEQPVLGGIKFQTHTSDISVTDTNKSLLGTYDNNNIKSVYSVHWGLSNLRQSAVTLAGSLFTEDELRLAMNSTISSYDKKNTCYYTTEDLLYAPNVNAAGSTAPFDELLVGESDNVYIDATYSGAGSIWTRRPSESSETNCIYVTKKEEDNTLKVKNDSVTSTSNSSQLCLKLDLDKILFASSAVAQDGFHGIANSPMTLKVLANNDTASCDISTNAVTVRNANGWRLMVQGTTDNGTSWNFSQLIKTDDALNFTPATVTSQMLNLDPETNCLENFEYCRVWLEQPVNDNTSLAYAIPATYVNADAAQPIDISGLPATVHGRHTFDGTQHEPGVTVHGVDENAYRVQYLNNTDAGTATAVIEGNETNGYTGRILKEFTIERAAFSCATIGDQTYTGSNVCPELTVKNIPHTDVTLTKDKDYIVTYENNVNAGSARALLTGTYNYKGKVMQPFTIEPKEIPSNAIQGTIAEQDYTGNAICPSVEVKDGSTPLVKNRDYIVEYSDNVNVGEATVIVTGIGNYKGIAKRTFNIVDSEQALKGHTITYHVGFGEDLKYSAVEEDNVKGKPSQNLKNQIAEKKDDNNLLTADELPDLGLIKAAQNNRYVFLGWYYDSEYKMPAGAGAAISGNINLYAKWGLKGNLSGTGKICDNDRDCYRWILSNAVLTSKMSPYTWKEIKKVGIFGKTEDITLLDLNCMDALAKGETVLEEFWR